MGCARRRFPRGNRTKSAPKGRYCQFLPPLKEKTRGLFSQHSSGPTVPILQYLYVYTGMTRQKIMHAQLKISERPDQRSAQRARRRPSDDGAAAARAGAAPHGGRRPARVDRRAAQYLHPLRQRVRPVVSRFPFVHQGPAAALRRAGAVSSQSNPPLLLLLG